MTEVMAEMRLAGMEECQKVTAMATKSIASWSSGRISETSSVIEHADNEGTARLQRMVLLAMREEQNLYKGRLQVRY